MSYRHLSSEERNVIWQMRILGKSRAEIARCLGRSRSTVSRELRRNAGFDCGYSPAVAQALADARRRRHIRCPKTRDPRLMAYVVGRLERRWSPEQIAGHLRGPGQPIPGGEDVAGLLGRRDQQRLARCDAAAAAGQAAHADGGQRPRVRTPRGSQPAAGPGRVLRPSVLLVGTGHERELGRPAASVPAQGDGLRALDRPAVGIVCSPDEPASSQVPQLSEVWTRCGPDPGRGLLASTRCTYDVNSLSLASAS